MTEFDKPSFSRPEVQVTNEHGEVLHTYSYSTTPLFDPHNIGYQETEKAKINSSLAVARPSLQAVYPGHAKYVEDLLAVSCEYALQQRLMKARGERDEFIARLLFEDHDTAEAGRKLANYHRIGQMFSAGMGRHDGDPEGFEGLAMHRAFFEAIFRPMERLDNPRAALQFLRDNPLLRSAELTNMTHPLRWDAPEPMADAVDDTIKRILPGAETFTDDAAMDLDVRRTHTVTQGIYAIVRTKQVHAYDEPSGIGVIKRSNYIINLCNETGGSGKFAPEHAFVRDTILDAVQKGVKVSECDSAQNIAAVFRDVLHIDPLFRPQWLEPGVTSYYAAREARLLRESTAGSIY